MAASEASEASSAARRAKKKNGLSCDGKSNERGSLKREKKQEEEAQQQAWQACNLALNHTAQSTMLASKNTDVNHPTHRVITRTKFELRRETTYTDVDERNKAGEQYSKKTFYTEVEKRNQAQIYSY